MNKLITLNILAVLAYVHSNICMEIEISSRNPRNVCHLLQNNGAWLEQLNHAEAQGNYCQDLCIARHTLRNVLSNSSLYESPNANFPGMYKKDEKWLKHQFGAKAAQLAINAVQQIKIAEHTKDLMQICSEQSDVNKINSYIQEWLSDNRQFSQLNLATHFSDVDGTTLLHHAASRLILHRILWTMLKHGKNPDLLDAYGQSPLFYAIKEGALDNMNLLIQHNAHKSLRDCNGFNPLHIAAQHNQFFCIKEEINIPYNDCPNNFGNTPLHVTLKNRASTKTVKKLLENYGFDCCACDLQGQSYVDLTITHKQPENEKLIRAQLDKNLLAYIDGCYHHFTAEKIENLLRRGANINAQNEKGETLLHSKQLEIQTLAMLLKHNANVSIKDNTGKTPLDVAIYNWPHQMISLLLDHGALITPKQHMNLIFYMTGMNLIFYMTGLRSVNEMGEKEQQIFELIDKSYKQQKCCSCHETQEKLAEEKCSLNYTYTGTRNHKREFICFNCLDSVL
ncbi:MAG TPA: ankyrin repeat domain-containing protein [Candidatus Babeliales bacterium]|nr:ankyrin repeat domain-containing protein [Candidatus Babeliales bacterium]